MAAVSTLAPGRWGYQQGGPAQVKRFPAKACPGLDPGCAGRREWRHSGNERRGATVRAQDWQPRTTRMTRFLIFAAMAPPLGFVVAFWVMLQIANWLAGSPTTFD